MFSREENELLTRVGPGTAMGDLMRRYWLPALLSEEIALPDSPPVRVRLLGENLIAFRDSGGRVGLLDEHCSHRGTSLFYGRNEECGLRCIYHGWKYDVGGNVLETPAEPSESDFKRKIHHTAYPCKEVAGIVFTYMGPREKMPLFPAYEWTSLPENRMHVVKSYLECNYLQGIEGDFDSSHTTFLHCNNLADLARLNRDGAPTLEAEETAYGMRAISIRRLRDEQSYVRVSPFIMPAFSIVPGPATAKFEENDSRAFRFWIPIDDTSTWFYILTMRDVAFSEEEKTKARSWVDASYRRIRNAGNDYLQDRELQRTRIYSGIKAVIPAEQDGCATESMGPIYDRTKEHLGYSDKTIIALRKILLRAAMGVREGREPPHIIRDASANDFSRLRALKGVLAANRSWRELLDSEEGLA
ncbi:MAG TPA: Rieske 2Fe-2S domain-containing protein [Candidatus Binatia bacterium]|jgi:phthalate 4,5-dioxygenase|nr:Rieske 2Fe-2S domain-containing protein [Candidatus Binatia bacterium]